MNVNFCAADRMTGSLLYALKRLVLTRITSDGFGNFQSSPKRCLIVRRWLSRLYGGPGIDSEISGKVVNATFLVVVSHVSRTDILLILESITASISSNTRVRNSPVFSYLARGTGKLVKERDGNGAVSYEKTLNN